MKEGEYAQELNKVKERLLVLSPTVKRGLERECDKSDFYRCDDYYIGKGGFGEVWKVNHKKTNDLFVIKVLDKKRIIIQFSDQKSRIKFTEDYNNVKQNFIGVELKFISEAEKDRLINNNANRMSFGNSFFNNYRNNSNNMIQMPKKKSNYQKFWDVFLNL